MRKLFLMTKMAMSGMRNEKKDPESKRKGVTHTPATVVTVANYSINTSAASFASKIGISSAANPVIEVLSPLVYTTAATVTTIPTITDRAPSLTSNFFGDDQANSLS